MINVRQKKNESDANFRERQRLAYKENTIKHKMSIEGYKHFLNNIGM